MRILVVEDDKKIASFIVNGLKQSGYAVDHSADGENGLIAAQTISYDAAVVDIMLPKLDGLSLVQQLRAKGIRMPILVLRARPSVAARVKCLQPGGCRYHAAQTGRLEPRPAAPGQRHPHAHPDPQGQALRGRPGQVPPAWRLSISCCPNWTA